MVFITDQKSRVFLERDYVRGRGVCWLADLNGLEGFMVKTYVWVCVCIAIWLSWIRYIDMIFKKAHDMWCLYHQYIYIHIICMIFHLLLSYRDTSDHSAHIFAYALISSQWPYVLCLGAFPFWRKPNTEQRQRWTHHTSASTILMACHNP